MTALAVEAPEALGFLYDPPLGALRYRVVFGGRGSSKSWSVARALLVHGLAAPLRILCAREYQSSIRDSVHRLLAEQITGMGLDGTYTVEDSRIYSARGTEFFFKGIRKDIMQIKSTEGIDLCWVEEAEAVTHHSWQTLIPTIRKPGSEIWVSFNPALPTDSTYRRFVETRPARSIVKRVSWLDNPWLPDVLLEEQAALLIADPEAHAHVWGGEAWQRSDAQVLAGKWRVMEFEPGDGWQGPYFGADWGFAQDPTVLVRMWTHDKRLYIDYSPGGVQLDTDMIDRLFWTVPGADSHTIRADSARPETINEMKKRGFKVTGAEKWKGNVADGISHLRTYTEIVIHPRCARAINEARLWRYRVDPRTQEVLPALHPGHDHCLAAGTLVDTGAGQVPIERLVGTEGVAFTTGGREYYHSVRQTSPREALYEVRLADGRAFRCTADHPILTHDGWQPAIALTWQSHILTVDTIRYGVRPECPQKSSCSQVVGMSATTKPDTTSRIRQADRQPISIGMFGWPNAARFLRAMMSIIRTATRTQPTRLVSNAWMVTRTLDCMALSSLRKSVQYVLAALSSWPPQLLVHGIEAPKDSSGTPRTRRSASRDESFAASVGAVASHTSRGPLSRRESFARMLASPHGDGRPASMTFSGNVLSAPDPSPPTGTPIPPAVHGPALNGCVRVERVEFVGYGPVYNMEVDEAHHFAIEGGLIVHNCWDAVRYGLDPLIKRKQSVFVA